MCCPGPIWEAGLVPVQWQWLGVRTPVCTFSPSKPRYFESDERHASHPSRNGISQPRCLCGLQLRLRGLWRHHTATWLRKVPAHACRRAVSALAHTLISGDELRGARPTLKARSPASARGSPLLPSGYCSNSVPPRASARLLAGIRWARGAAVIVRHASKESR